MQKYTQLTCEQRYHIYLLNKQGYNQTFIAKSMGRNKSTISRELSRNTGKRGYRHKQANRLADERHQKKNKAIKLTDSVKNYIETFA
ncbi:Mobile element protein [uncultured Gammaproteobacteria bacterium]|nr:Mobile element protein [uncultured Gammaproteobacteria bacterium]VVH58019.1 Mobile element protein [uncultured Gammaproteobacteria bacterium]VVM28285.1 Mobile element protein [uncultured Gammaproteobacteria bacterium]